ncbi:putative FBD-associated F-box protein At5g38570 [Malus sylvestris]|uniref:putative FBD-associated F-box protein At5g38570 n=1 Tax=Malus sylvestris TaxID=3752 RepID=UPI0021AC9FFD|nr:putative FBD-associated F-box protein At5g38570 [Malus sylvestris]
MDGDLPVFDNLNQLELDFSDCDYSELLTKLLKSSPKLENLVIKRQYCTESAEEYSNAEDEEFDPPEAVPICLMSHLKITTVNEFRGRPYDKEVVTYLLKNGEVLNKMTVSTMKAFGDRQSAEENALRKEVLLFRRGSKTCQVEMKF